MEPLGVPTEPEPPEPDTDAGRAECYGRTTGQSPNHLCLERLVSLLVP